MTRIPRRQSCLVRTNPLDVRRKATVVQAVRNGALTLDEACERYNVSVEEFWAWERDLDRHGLPGLRTTRLPTYLERRLVIGPTVRQVQPRPSWKWCPVPVRPARACPEPPGAEPVFLCSRLKIGRGGNGHP